MTGSRPHQARKKDGSMPHRDRRRPPRTVLVATDQPGFGRDSISHGHSYGPANPQGHNSCARGNWLQVLEDRRLFEFADSTDGG